MLKKTYQDKLLERIEDLEVNNRALFHKNSELKDENDNLKEEYYKLSKLIKNNSESSHNNIIDKVSLTLYSIAIVLTIGYVYLAYSNWTDAKQIVQELVQENSIEDFNKDKDKKFIGWNSAINNRNEIDRTFFDSLRDGFIGLTAISSLITYLDKLKKDKSDKPDIKPLEYNIDKLVLDTNDLENREMKISLPLQIPIQIGFDEKEKDNQN